MVLLVVAVGIIAITLIVAVLVVIIVMCASKLSYTILYVICMQMLKLSHFAIYRYTNTDREENFTSSATQSFTIKICMCSH